MPGLSQIRSMELNRSWTRWTAIGKADGLSEVGGRRSGPRRSGRLHGNSKRWTRSVRLRAFLPLSFCIEVNHDGDCYTHTACPPDGSSG